MNIWLVTIGEPILHPTNKLRLHRTGLLAKFIAEQTDNNVIWWTSTFNHFTKQHEYDQDTKVNILPNLKMIALKGKGYNKNISIDRIIDHGQIAKKFKKMISTEEKPDIIIASFPTLGLCEVALDYGLSNDVPVLIDYRDMWPEIYLEVLPKFLRKFGSIPLYPLLVKTRKVFKKATGLIAITNSFMEIALKKANRKKHEFDEYFYLGYLKNQYSQSEYLFAKSFWDNMGIVPTSKLRICYFGVIGNNDLDTVIEGAKILVSEGITNFEIIICGSGDKEVDFKNSSKEIKQLIFPGYMNSAQIALLLSISHIGLCPYNTNQAFLNSIPGKAIEYMSAGLPLLSTLKDGQLGKLIIEENIGYHYAFKNPRSFASTVSELIDVKAILKDKKDQILNLFNTKFNGERIYPEFYDHIVKVKNLYYQNE